MSLSPSALPFDDIRNLVRQMPGPDEEAVAEVRARDAQLTKPAGSLGKLEELAEWLAGWSGRGRPKVSRPVVAIFAANHGVANRGVSAFPASVTRQMVENFAAGGAAINQICIAHDLGLKIFDLALDVPTPDIAEEDAFDEANCAATMAFGMEAVAGGTDLLCIGEMGIAVLHAMDPRALDHCLFAHVSAEPAHRMALEKLGKTPLLDLGMRLGEGTGAALAAGIVRAAAQVHDGMATFADAGVSGKSEE